MFCFSCGKEILDDSSFCKYCGKEQPSNNLNGMDSIQYNSPCDGCGFGDEEYWDLVNTERKHCDNSKYLEKTILEIALQGIQPIEDTYSIPIDKDFLLASMVAGIDSMDKFSVLGITPHAIYAARYVFLDLDLAMVIFFNAAFDTTKMKICCGSLEGLFRKKKNQAFADEAFEAMRQYALAALEDDDEE